MKFNIYMFLLFFCALIGNNNALFAQKRTFDDFNEVQLRNIMPIKHNNHMIGYCMFYFIDEAEEEYVSNYKIVLLDTDLKKVVEKSITHSYNIKLYEIAYNGTHLLLVFFNKSLALFEYVQYDLQLNEQSRCSAKLTTSESIIIDNHYTYLGNIVPHIVPLDGVGFAMYSLYALFGAKQYSITHISNDGKIPWEMEGTEDEVEEKGMFPIFLAANKDIALNIIRTEVVNGFKYKAYSLKTGKNVFLKEILIEGKKTRPMCATVDSVGNFSLGGLFFEKEQKKKEAYPQGFFMATIDPAGNLLRHKLYRWKDIEQDKLGLDDFGKYKEKGNLMIVDMKVLPNGNFLLIGECIEGEPNTFRLSYLHIRDLILIEVDQAFNVVHSTIVEKQPRSVSAEPGQINNLSEFEKRTTYQSIVDYRFIQASTKGFSVFYNYDASKDEKGLFYKVISRQFGEQEYLSDKIQLETKASSTYVLSAKPGHLLFVEYYKKERKLDLRLEKFNY